MKSLSALLATLLVSLSSGCFCPQLISPSCGCGGGGYNSYAGGGYGGGGYSSSGSYATFYRDLTPFRQPYYQVPAYPQYYPPSPSRSLPPMYQLPNPRYIQPPMPPRPQYVRPNVPASPPAPYNPQPQPTVYIQPAAPVAPLAETQKVTLHDNNYGEEIVETTTYAPAVTTEYVPEVVTERVTAAPVDEAPDFVDEAPAKKGEKEEFYYAYYDDKGNKVGDSRSGTTFSPDNVIVEVETTASPVHLEVTTERIQAEQNYDDVIEETQVPVRTSLAPSYTPEVVTSTTVLFMEPRFEETTATHSENSEVVYEDETVEYENDDHPESNPGPSTKEPETGEFKRTVQDNQIMVDAAENTGEGYRVNGVRIMKRYKHDERKIHSN